MKNASDGRGQVEPSRKTVLQRLHALWRLILIARDGEKCRAVGQGGMRCGGSLQAHHIFGKGPFPRLRFDLENGIILCGAHHAFWVESGPPSDVAKWLEETVGITQLKRLSLRAHTASASGKPMDLYAVRLYLEQEYAKHLRKGGRQCASGPS